MVQGTGSAAGCTRPAIYVTTAQRERLFSRLAVDPGGCLLWTGSLNKDGYGSIQVGSRTNGTYRKLAVYQVTYAMLVGPVPDGLELDHLCRVRRCAAPDHLEPVTHRVNLLRGDTVSAKAAAATHCSKGHEFDLINTYFTVKDGRRCRRCWTENNQRRAAAARARSAGKDRTRATRS
jgi:hypothetical protein